MVEPLRPKLTLLLLEKTMLDRLPLAVPAEIITGEGDAVPPDITIEPADIPTDTLPAPLNVIDLASIVELELWPVVFPEA